MKKTAFSLLFMSAALYSFGQRNATIGLKNSEANQQISKHIYGHFAEHLGTCIYGGIWVGPESSIPNKDGYRTDVLDAMKKLNIPNLRWPGGCFADEYHWMDGIGPKDGRPKMVNNNWGGTIEDNSFGTHEFLNLCELLDCEPYISGNVGSGTVEELAKWVEYMTSDGDSPMANLRRQNGRDKAWKVKYLGVGNESWGCGGNMTPDYYANEYRRYQTYCREYDDNKLYKIASGSSDYDYNWTETLMRNAGRQMNGLSIHYYTVKTWDGSKGSATDFSKSDFYWTIGKALEIEPVLVKHMGIMDKHDPKRNVGLMVDEWGTWWDEEPGTIRGHLYQQNTLRDAFVAAASLNVFNKYGERIKMANIAQIVNVLQSIILTKDDKMVLTPTYYVFDMYKGHQDATYIPLEISCDDMPVDGDRTIPMLSASASKSADGKVLITLANFDVDKPQTVTINLDGLNVKNIDGKLLTAKSIDSYNDFNNTDEVKMVAFKDAKVSKGVMTVKMPSKSIVSLQLN